LDDDDNPHQVKQTVRGREISCPEEESRDQNGRSGRLQGGVTRAKGRCVMRLSPEICQRILALHLLLGFADGRDEKRSELLKLLGEFALGWNSLPEFFAHMKVATAAPLPAAGSKN
jgi:hypothetical protein